MKWALKGLCAPEWSHLISRTESFNENIQLAYFNLPEAVSDTNLYVWDNFGSVHFESALKALKGVLESIKAQAFWPPAEGPIKWDDFEDLFMAEECVKELNHGATE